MAGFKYTVRLVLQQTEDKNKLTPIRCFVRYNATRSVFPSGISIEPKYFITEETLPGSKQKGSFLRLRKSAGFAGYEKVSADLKKLDKWIEVAFNYLTDKNKAFPNPDELKELCTATIKNNGVLPGAKVEKQLNFIEYIDIIIGDTRSGKRTLKGGQRFSQNTPVSYNTTKGVLEEFIKFSGRKELNFQDINLEFYNDLKDWCYGVKSYADNYFGNIVKNIKTFMNEGLEAKIHTNHGHESKRFVKVQTDVDNVYLDQDQLELIAGFDFSDKPKLERVRDLFLVGCWTGLRFSDFRDIPASAIAGDFIEIKTQKTKETVAIPIHPILRTIMNRYEGKTLNSLPPPISNVKLNEYIKEVAQETKELSMLTSLQKARAGKKITVTKPLHELISTHTARRAFASNMFKMGVPTLVIMAVTGHRTEKAFLKYIKVTPKEKAAIMLEVWNRGNLKIVTA